MAITLIKKRVLGIAMTSFYEERRKDIRKSPTIAFCVGTPEKKHLL
jgi:hypothetical protein